MSGVDTGSTMTPTQEGIALSAATRINEITRRMASDIVEIGRILIGVKESLQHGSYLPWLKMSFGWTERTASNYVNVAENIGENAKHVSHLPLATVYQLAAPGTPPTLREGILKRIEGGEPMQRAEIDSQLGQVRRAAKDAKDKARELDRKTPEAIKRAQTRQDRERQQEERTQREWEKEQEQKDAARASAAALILEKLDYDDLQSLLMFMATAGELRYTDLAGQDGLRD